MFTPDINARKKGSLNFADAGETADKIITAVRVRPISDQELSNNCRVIMVPDSKEPGMCIVDPIFYSADKKDTERRAYERHFKYDHFFWSANINESVVFATQQIVFDTCAKPLVGHCVSGYNCALLAYGQTGSGKTHTMMGYETNEENAGVIPRLCKALIEESDILTRERNQTNVIDVSYYEIYNEKVYDLLSNTVEIVCRVREHPDQGAYVEGLTRVPVKSYDDVSAVIYRGGKHRAVASTLLNSTSSRSHAVFTVHLTQSIISAGNESMLTPLADATTNVAPIQRFSKVLILLCLGCIFVKRFCSYRCV